MSQVVSLLLPLTAERGGYERSGWFASVSVRKLKCRGQISMEFSGGMAYRTWKNSEWPSYCASVVGMRSRKCYFRHRQQTWTAVLA